MASDLASNGRGRVEDNHLRSCPRRDLFDEEGVVGAAEHQRVRPLA